MSCWLPGVGVLQDTHLARNLGCVAYCRLEHQLAFSIVPSEKDVRGTGFRHSSAAPACPPQLCWASAWNGLLQGALR